MAYFGVSSDLQVEQIAGQSAGHEGNVGILCEVLSDQ
jgi:hypothetical protein